MSVLFERRVRLTAAWVLVIGLITLAPFTFEPGDRRPLLLFDRYQQDPLDFLANVLLFVPLGALLRKSSTGQRTVAACMAAGGLLSLMAECLQGWLPSRDSSLIDVVANTAGTALGAALTTRYEDRLTGALQSARTVVLAGTFAVVAIVSIVVSGLLQEQTRLDNWSPAYPLVIGNEATGNRPWHGRVIALEMRDEAASADALRRFADGAAPTLRGAAIASFDLSGQPPFADRSHGLPPLVAAHDGRTPAHPSEAEGIAPWLQTSGAAEAIARRVRQTNAFSLHVVCASASPDQHGPARIVSNSPDPNVRNFMLGQQQDALVVRLRTPVTSLNGNQPELVVPGVFADVQPKNLLVTYDGTTLSVAVAHSSDVRTLELTPGSTAARLFVPAEAVRADQEPAFAATYVAGLFVVPGFLVGVMNQARRHRIAFGVWWPVAMALALELTIVMVSGRPFLPLNVAETSLIGAAVIFGVASIVEP